METLRVCMLGGFSLETRGHRIDDSDTRSQKPWLLMAYLLHYRSRTVTQEEMFRVCWDDNEKKDDPANGLRVVLHRARTTLDALEVVSGLDMIVRTPDGFRWSDWLSVSTDVDEFDRLCVAGSMTQDPQARLAYYEKAVALYRGDFLRKYAAQEWVKELADQYRQKFWTVAREMLSMLEEAERWEDVVFLCRKGLKMQSCCQSACCRLMHALLELGRPEEAADVYEWMRGEILNCGEEKISPQAQELYFQAIGRIGARNKPLEELCSDLCRPETERKVLVCDFTFFRMICFSAAHLAKRNRVEMYVGLFTVSFSGQGHVSKRAQERAVELLTQQVELLLHPGDIAARYEKDKLAVLIRPSSYEESCRTCEEIVTACYRENPNLSMKFNYVVQPLRA